MKFGTVSPLQGRGRIFTALGLAIISITLLVYGPVLGYEFINFDDPDYITDNQHVTEGITWAGVLWAFTTGHASNWHPLTWISHMLDCHVFDLNPGGHHFTNLVLHTGNTLLLFLLLARMTGTVWRSAIVAAIFAWHPLHVESVAWISERKDVLSTFFWLATLLCYAEYTRKKAWRAYVLTLLLFAFGLMSKPMVVTLPFVLLLVDYWPLERFRFAPERAEHLPSKAAPQFSAGTLLCEKLPFFALSLGSCIATFLAQKAGGAVVSSETLPFQLRAENAVVSYARYISKAFFPTNLAIPYPYPDRWAFGVIALSVLAVLALSVGCALRARRQPYLMVGWLWFLGTLVPTLGLVQVGPQAMADRYMYIPSIGLLIAIVWGLQDVAMSSKVRFHRVLAMGLAILFCIGCLVWTREQLKVWRNSEALFRHAIQVTKNNHIAAYSLAQALKRSGKKEEALRYYIASVQTDSRFAPAQYHLGMALLEGSRLNEALQYLTNAVELAPGSPEAQSYLGAGLMKAGRLDESVARFRNALTIDPQFAYAHNGLAKVLSKQGRWEEALDHLTKAITFNPRLAEAHYNLGTVLLIQSRIEAAIPPFTEALRLKPAYADAHGNLAVALMRLGRSNEANPHFLEALRLAPENPQVHENFGIALLEQGQAAEAEIRFREALRLRPDDAGLHYRLGTALANQHKSEDAIHHTREALRIQPDFPLALSQLAWLLSCDPNPLIRSGEEAVRLAERACALKGEQHADTLLTLAVAYAEVGRFSDAASAAARARELATITGENSIATKSEVLLKLFQEGIPYREQR